VTAAPIAPITAPSISTLLRPDLIKKPAAYEPNIIVKVAELPTIDSIFVCYSVVLQLNFALSAGVI